MTKGKTQSAGRVMKIINNITDKLSDELKEKLEPGSKLSIAAACFSVYAFEELKTQLEGIDALRFIFTSPTFLAEQPEKAQREFYIPRLNREKTLYGSEFEIRLRNEFTQKAISRECAEWVRRKASFKSNVTSELMPGFMTVENAAPCAFAPVNGFTRADLGCERGGNMFSMINEIDAPESAAYLTLFDQLWTDRRKLKDVTDQVLERITTAYRENTEPIVMDGIKTKKLVENAEMDFAELMFQMYAEPGNSYGDITRYFVKHSIKVYDKALQRGFISKLLRNPVYVQADMDIYEYYKAQGVKIESPPEMFTGDNSCYLYQGREGEEQILVIAPHQGRISSQLWLTVQRKLSQNTSFQNGRKCHNTWLAGKIKCGRCGYALAALRAQNGVTYLRCKQRAENGSCEGAGTLTAQSMEAFVYGEMVKKMQKFHTLKGGKEQSYNPKLTAARVALAKTESEIEKLLDTLSGANPLLLQYANNRIEELDAERQKQLRLVADLTANSVSASQIDSITGYLDDWESVSFDDKRKVVDILISQIDATSEEVVIHWKI